MTTIAVDKTMMAGDRQFTHSGGYRFQGKTKIYDLPEDSAKTLFNRKRVFMGFSGDAGEIGDVVNWLYTLDGKPPRLRNLEIVCLLDNKEILTSCQRLDNWIVVTGKYHAIGSGAQFALGALEQGATPYDAVKTAMKFDANTGMGLTKLTL